MNYKNLLIALGFSPQEGTVGVFFKKYPQADSYCLEVNIEKQAINYGNLITSDSKTTQNFSQPENFVVLECVNHLLEKGYKPENIVLEKTYPAGHGTSGRLDICVTRDDGSEYLLIECKTYGKEFEKEFTRMKKDGGQLFTYFKFSNKADIIMLYASELKGNEIAFCNGIVKIEDDYRTGDVKDFYERWNKQTYNIGVWENSPYDFQPKKFTKADLKELTEEASKKLFHGFASILRKHSVSDKPNAFNVIFNLFLAKLYDEAKSKNKELDFHWRENDDSVDFQVRLYNLHKKGLLAFLKKEIEGIEDFKISDEVELKKAKKKFLKFNKLFDIKSVFNDDDFEQNHRVLKEVVQLIENYQIRYPRKQRHLSEFFELLLTTGLKQEAGQYFTPPPITKFITKSLPLQSMIEGSVNNEDPKLPAMIDYAAGSGHFITEIMEEYQEIINSLKPDENYPEIAIKEINGWKANPYSWAARYIYGIEKDYRLVKTAKVGCYFYGDGLAQVIHGDGLDSFEKSKSYIGLLKENAKKPQFSVIVSNPPYSVNDCKDDLEYIGAQSDFTLYNYLTDKSKEIETLFLERTGQLLKDNGVAGVILPSSILSNTGIYTKAREIVLQSFEIVAIAKFGSNTFMETGTNTVVLFLRRRNDAEVQRIREAAYRLAESYPKTHEDLTINGIEKPVQKYLAHTQQTEIDSEKLYYFILAYPQKNVVIINSGDKDEEKRFLGYEFSKRRGNEGMHSIQRSKTIDGCTQLYDDKNQKNPEKANSYIYKAFTKEYLPVDEAMKKNVAYADLVDMLTFDRESFDKNISLAVKKKVKVESQWKFIKLEDVAIFIKRGKSARYGNSDIQIIKSGQARGIKEFDFSQKYYVDNNFVLDERKLEKGDILINSTGIGTAGRVTLFDLDGTFVVDSHITILRPNKEKVLPDFILQSLVRIGFKNIEAMATGQSGQIELSLPTIQNIKIPLPPLEIQQKIVSEIEALEKKETEAKEKIKTEKEYIERLFSETDNKTNKILRLSDDTVFDVSIGKRVIEADLNGKGEIPVYSANVFVPFGYIDKYLITDFSTPSVLWGIDGDWMVNYTPADKPFYPTDHCGILRVKTKEILPKYLAWVLNKEGVAQNFSRTLRASIDRIKGLNIKIPPFFEQQRIVSEIETIEAQIAEAQKIIDDMPIQKNEILRKYL